MTFIKFLAALALCASPAAAQHAHGNHRGGEVAETGQAQFASIAEIVSVLRGDPSTDWDAVNIQALRDHLIDMDNVTTRSEVEMSVDGETVTFAVTGDGDAAISVQNMITAHGPMLATETGWFVTSTLLGDGALMEVTVPDQGQLDEVVGLGFYGLMTIGAHHQEHHLMIARGHAPH